MSQGTAQLIKRSAFIMCPWLIYKSNSDYLHIISSGVRSGTEQYSITVLSTNPVWKRLQITSLYADTLIDRASFQNEQAHAINDTSFNAVVRQDYRQFLLAQLVTLFWRSHGLVLLRCSCCISFRLQVYVG